MNFHSVPIWYFILATETKIYSNLLQNSGKFPVESSSIEFVILIWQSLDSPMDQLIQEVMRVLKEGGTTLIRKSSQSIMGSDDKVITNSYIVP